MRSHHKQAHGESIAGFEYTCEWCGESGVKRQIDDYDDHQFCSKECYHSWQSEVLSGENSPAWEGRTLVVDCDYCGESTEKAAVNYENNEHAFCSRRCHADWMSENKRGENATMWDGGDVEVECGCCGSVFKTQPAKAKRNSNNFCSRDCYGEWISNNVTGEDHPRWVGGRSITYGPNWHKKRKERMEKDGYECVVCSISNEEHKERHGMALHVHHITPAMKYHIEGNQIDYEKANRIENLITLCVVCHRKWEGVPLRPEVQD
jgi:endogenous inhibitor of DNA gyrase (YacG/DUF329 family)